MSSDVMRQINQKRKAQSGNTVKESEPTVTSEATVKQKQEHSKPLDIRVEEVTETDSVHMVDEDDLEIEMDMDVPDVVQAKADSAESQEPKPAYQPPIQSPQQSVIEPTRRIRGVERTFKSLSGVDRIAFRGLFVQRTDGNVQFDETHQTFAVKGVSSDLLEQVQEDLKNQFKNVDVKIGAQWHAIDSGNAVFNANTSTVRYLLYNQMASDQTALKVARQMLLEKHPDAEESDFDFNTVRSDVLDIYAVLLASKAEPEKDLFEKVEELILKVDKMNDSQEYANHKMFGYAASTDKQLTGLMLSQSMMVLEKFGLLQGALPKNTSDLAGLLSQDKVFLIKDFLSVTLPDQIRSKRETLAREKRQKDAGMKRKPVSQDQNQRPLSR